MAMSRDELLAVVKSQLGNTTKYANDEFRTQYEALLDSYNREPYGNEMSGRSSVVSSDHFETVESDMPPLARIFLGSNKILSFKPRGEADAEEARQKTEYANYLIREQRDSFKILHDWMKEAGFSPCSVLKYYPSETTKTEYVKYSDLSEDEMAVLISDLKSADRVKQVEIVSSDEVDGRFFNVEIKLVKESKKIVIANVPPTSFIISRGAATLEDAAIVGDESIKTKGDLIADGFDKKLVKDLPCAKKDDEITRKRFKDIGGYDQASSYHWTNEEVQIQYLYALVDVDEDGIPERRLIVKCGDVILHEEPYGHIPYAVLSQILMPHSVIGKSRGEYAASIQIEKTAIERGMRDNIYSVLRPRIAVDDSDGSIDGGKVDLDDLLNEDIEGVIRVDGAPAEALMPIVTPYIGDSALQIVQYIDARKGSVLGSQAATQGLSADRFYKETATRFEGVADLGQAKVELLARVIAETGFRQLFEGVIWTAQHYQDDAAEIMVLGKPMTVDPRNWRYEHYCQSEVGLGAGDSEEVINNLGAVYQAQIDLLGRGSPMVDHGKIYNTLADLVRAMGKADVSRYLNDPAKPEALLMQQNEQLMQLAGKQEGVIQSLQQQVAINEARARTQIAVEDNRAKRAMEVEAEKQASDINKFLIEQTNAMERFRREMMATLTELDLKYNGNPVNDIPGTLEDGM